MNNHVTGELSATSPLVNARTNAQRLYFHYAQIQGLFLLRHTAAP